MASKTTNLGLTLVGTSAEDTKKVFSEYRQIVNGETGTSNAELIDAAYGELAGRVKTIEDNGTTVEYYDEAPAALGTASPGTSASVARGDHVHKMPTASQVGAVPASRTVNGKALSGNITLTAEDVGALPSDTEIPALDATLANSGQAADAKAVGDAIEKAKSEIQSEIESANAVHRYGILWDRTNAACTRLYDAVGLTANAHLGTYNPDLVNDFDNLYPWSGRRVCNVDVATYKALVDGGEDVMNSIVAWEGDPDFSYTGENGAVMVYTPEYWMKTEETESGIEVVIADGEIQGYIHVPAIVGGRWWATDDGNGGVSCVAGAIPMGGSVSMGNIHAAAKTVGMTLDDIYTYSAETALYAVEFATMNSQTALGNGADSVNRETETDMPLIDISGSNYVVAPIAFANIAMVGAILEIGTAKGGRQIARRSVTSIENYSESAEYKIIRFSGDPVDIATTQYLSIHGIINTADEEIGSGSGYIGVNGKAHAYYRGRVFHANINRYTLGVYREKGTGHIWIAHSRSEADAYDTLDTSVHKDTGCVIPYNEEGTTQSGAIGNLHFLKSLPLAPFPSAMGGNSTNPVGDTPYFPAKTSNNTVLAFGGFALIGSGAGRFYGHWNYTSGTARWHLGGVPFFK